METTNTDEPSSSTVGKLKVLKLEKYSCYDNSVLSGIKAFVFSIQKDFLPNFLDVRTSKHFPASFLLLDAAKNSGSLVFVEVLVTI